MLRAIIFALVLVPLTSFAFFGGNSSSDSDSGSKSSGGLSGMFGGSSDHVAKAKDASYAAANKMYQSLLGTEKQQQALLQKLVDHYPQAKKCVTSGTSVDAGIKCLGQFFNK